MKYLLITFLLIQSHWLFAQQTVSEEIQIQNLIQNSFDGIFSDFDAQRLGEFYTEDFLLLEHGEVWDIEIVRGYLKRAKSNPNPPRRTNRFEFIETKIFGDRAWVAYHNFATISRDGEVIQELYWLESATAVRTSTGWRLDMLHSTRAEGKK